MALAKPTVLFVTDLYYEAKGRPYYAEDIFLSSQLREDFNIIICHPTDTLPFESIVDVIIFRNTGPVIYYQKAYDAFRHRHLHEKIVVYNSLTGQADMRGKHYLVELTKKGFPVIPTVDSKATIDLLPPSEAYIIKPKGGADSIGMQVVDSDALREVDFHNTLLQPKIDIRYEVSFYYVDDELQYALYAPDPNKRWQLERYTYSDEDVRFAKKFIDWNPLEYGIQRVDACRTGDGELLLVELEDLNPYLSLLDIEEKVCQQFIEKFKLSLQDAISRTQLTHHRRKHLTSIPNLANYASENRTFERL